MTFHLQIVSPDGLLFDGQAVRLIAPTTQGQVGILPRHINYVTPLGMGTAKVVTEDGEQFAACIGGMLAVTDGQVRLVATTFEWAQDIDVARAEASLSHGEQELAAAAGDEEAMRHAQARLRRARVRLSVAKNLGL